jgi:hypothetical protein
MPDQALITNEVQSFLDTVGGDYVAAYNEIVADQERKVIARRTPSNAETRKAAYAKAVRLMDRKQLASMAKTVRNFLPLSKANAAVTAQTGVLDEAEAEDLMVEVLEVKRLQEMAKSRYEEIRKRVFNSITEGLAEQGEKDPEIVAGYIEVPKLGLKFTREGGGFADPELQEEVLAALVGTEVWDKVTRVEVIPAQEVRTLDMDLFLQEARRKPALLEELRKALKVGEPKGFKFHQRALVPDEE